MKFPIGLMARLSSYIAAQKWRGNRHFPLVLMLEPTHLCNLECAGCGRIREYESTLSAMMSAEECLAAVDECSAPVVSICGGEPLIHKEINRIVLGTLARKKYIYLCTNGVFLDRFFPKVPPHPNLFINVHFDGLEKTHDAIVLKKGTFKKAFAMMEEAKLLGYQLASNTTIFTETDMNEIEELFQLLTDAGVDHILVSPGYHYESVQENIFLKRAQIHEKFQQMKGWERRFPIRQTPIFMKFLRGEKELQCTPWGNVTRNPQGWKGPCYLITDAHHQSYRSLVSQTPWKKYGAGNGDRRCDNCMAHCGYEATVSVGRENTWADTWEMIRWSLS